MCFTRVNGHIINLDLVLAIEKRRNGDVHRDEIRFYVSGGGKTYFDIGGTEYSRVSDCIAELYHDIHNNSVKEDYKF